MKKYLVTVSRRSQYTNPIILNKGDIVKLGKEETGNKNWKGWIWCEIDSNAGWVPIQLIEKTGNNFGRMKENYDATELDVNIDEVLDEEYELNGWIWAVNEATKKAGWVPKESIAEIK